MEHIYTARVTVKGGRAGHARSDDGLLDVDLSLPKAFGGSGGNGTNPEQLFAAGYAACFESALRGAAGAKKIPVKDSSIAATVGIGPVANGGFGLDVKLDVTLTGPTQAQAEELVDVAHNVMCPYSNATRGNVDVKITVKAV